MPRKETLLVAATAACVLVFLVAAAGPSPAAGERDAVTLHDGDRQVLEYRYGRVPFKPYVRRFFTPGGVNVLRDAPHDHLHHHALMFAIGIDGVDFWTETPQCGRQVPVGSIVDKVIVCAQRLDWKPPNQPTPSARETRTIRVHADGSLGASLFTWRTELAPAEGRDTIKLWGRHYFGLGMRFDKSMDKAGEFFTVKGKAKGEGVRGDERLVKAPWIAYTAAVEGKPVTVAMFDYPKNPRPGHWFTMTKPFAYLSATLNLHREPMTLKAPETLAVVYGVAAWDGRKKPDEVESLYRRWLQLTSPKKPDAS